MDVKGWEEIPIWTSRGEEVRKWMPRGGGGGGDPEMDAEGGGEMQKWTPRWGDAQDGKCNGNEGGGEGDLKTEALNPQNGLSPK